MTSVYLFSVYFEFSKEFDNNYKKACQRHVIFFV